MWHRRAFPPADLLPCRRQDVGCYVDNLQIAHSVELDDNGRGPAGCAYNTFVDAPCEAEIIALSEAAKDVVYLRKLVSAARHGCRVRSIDARRSLPAGPVPRGRGRVLPPADRPRQARQARCADGGQGAEAADPDLKFLLTHLWSD